jgi:tetratricopeptide (TPR) repeat protein/tRNA A-37 threonylcarbamoyl transferase component Bud32
MSANRDKLNQVSDQAGATGEFQAEDVSQQTTDDATIERERAAQTTGQAAAGRTSGGRDARQQAEPAVSEATGEFQASDLPPARGAGLARGGSAPADATGEFQAEDVSQMTTDDLTQVRGRVGQVTNPAAPGAFPPVAPHMSSQRYAMKRFHARGGMGEIWLAEDCGINRPVALKKIREGRADLRDRFLLEAQITGQLEHPGVVPVYELGADEEGQPFYVMKFIRGRTLQDVIEEYHSPEGDKRNREVQLLRLLQNFINICQTVAYAHSRGVLHRDLKPDNVMVGEYGETLLLDWGLAKIMGQPEPDIGELPKYVHLTCSTESTQTQAGSIKGTPGYMAPEAAEGKPEWVDQASDIYLLGATLYHILAGRSPRGGNNLITILGEARTTPPPPVRSVNRTIPKVLNAICMKAMAFRKEDRYPAASRLAEDMQCYLAGEPISAYQENLLERTWRWMRRHRQLLGWSAAILMVLATGLFGYSKWQEAERQRELDRIEAADKLRAETERRENAQREKDELANKDAARLRLVDFRRLADEMRFSSAIPDPAGEQAPPLVDVEAGESKGRAAVALVEDWGPTLDRLPLAEQQPVIRSELYDLLLLMAQTRARLAAGPDAGKDMLGLLDRAAALREPTASYHRLRSVGYQFLGEKEKSTEEQRRANDPKTPVTALDHFLLGEQYRVESQRPPDALAEGESARTNREKKTRQAIEEYREALQQEPTHYWAHLQLGSSYLALGQPAEAAEALNACVALQPKSPWGYTVRGLALVALKRFSEATADLDQSIKLSPDFRLPRLQRGIAYWLQQKYDSALADFDAVLLPPDAQRLIEGAYYRGQVHLEREEYAEALKAFDQVVEAKRNFPSLHLFRARAVLSLGQQNSALTAMNAFLAAGKPFDPESAEAYGRRGRLLRLVLIPKLPAKVRGKSLQLAQAQLEKASDLGATSAAVFEDLGAVLEQLGQTARAVDAYTKALKIAPDDVKTRVKRGWAYADLQPPQYDKAREDFAAVVLRESAHGEAHAGLAYVQASRKVPAEARRQAGQALLHGAGDYLVLHNVACAYARLSQTDTDRAVEYEDLAIDQLRRAVELWQRGGTGPNELKLIEGEPAFPPSLRARPEFKELVRPKSREGNTR